MIVVGFLQYMDIQFFSFSFTKLYIFYHLISMQNVHIKAPHKHIYPCFI